MHMPPSIVKLKAITGWFRYSRLYFENQNSLSYRHTHTHTPIGVLQLQMPFILCLSSVVFNILMHLLFRKDYNDKVIQRWSIMRGGKVWLCFLFFFVSKLYKQQEWEWETISLFFYICFVQKKLLH